MKEKIANDSIKKAVASCLLKILKDLKKMKKIYAKNIKN